MTTVLLMLFLTQAGSGTITGQLRDTSGAPAVSIRVAVTPVELGAAGETLSSLTVTDKEGRYRLEDVLPGHYLIVAGALASPGYFPGVTARDQAKSVTVAAGQTVANMDFTLVPEAAPGCAISEGGVISDDFISTLRTLENLVDASSFIVDAVVQSTEPNSSVFSSEVGALLLVRNVLKGSDSPQQFAYSHLVRLGGLQMNPGQRFILFLDTNHRAYSAGTFCVENGRIRLGGNRLAGRYEDASVDKVIDEIRTYIRLPRVSGLIEVEGGVFPPAGSDRNLFKVALRTDASKPDGPAVAVAVDWSVLLRGMTSVHPGSRIDSIDREGRFTLALETGSYRVQIEGLPLGYEVKSMTYGNLDLLKESMRIGPALSELRIVLAKAREADK